MDDGLLTTRAKTEKNSVAKAQVALIEVEKWAYENSMVFDPAKFKAIHLLRKRLFPNPEIQLQPAAFQTDTSEPKIVQPVAKNASMRWLGVYFDPHLSFNDHAAKLASKGRRAASGLIMLANKVQGVNAKIMQRAAHACILPILTYAALAWWPGRTRINSKGKTI